jgi:hypothetical protein
VSIRLGPPWSGRVRRSGTCGPSSQLGQRSGHYGAGEARRRRAARTPAGMPGADAAERPATVSAENVYLTAAGWGAVNRCDATPGAGVVGHPKGFLRAQVSQNDSVGEVTEVSSKQAGD